MIHLRYQGITLYAGRTPILNAIDLAIDGPGVFALLGPSGAGKSSLLRLTQRLLNYECEHWRHTGDVRLDGESIFRRTLKPHQLARQVGFIQQQPWMLRGSVRDNVEFALRHTTRLPRHSVRRLAEAALERVGLIEELPSLDQPAWSLSGGQAHRLAIARALALEPRVILMDEPTAGLDPLCTERIEAVIRALAVEHLVVVVTHDVILAERIADAAAFMLRGPQGGRIVECSTAPGIFNALRHPQTRTFVNTAAGRSRRQEWAPKRRIFLFVCSGNTSRSPMAQAVCIAEVARRMGLAPEALQAAGVDVISAGLAVKSDAMLSSDAAAALAWLGVPVPAHTAQNVTADMVTQADAVFCMTEAQRRSLVERFPNAAFKTHRLDPSGDLDDPAGGGAEVFRRCVDQLRASICRRLDEIDWANVA